MIKSETKLNRSHKKQMGQFMTPIKLSKEICDGYNFRDSDIVLEPSFGEGSFLLVLLSKFVLIHINAGHSREYALTLALTKNVYGVELDPNLYEKTLNSIKTEYGFVPPNHNLVNCDFFNYTPTVKFNYVIGNPPFGGSINPDMQDALDSKYGTRFNLKIKKETYSFFIVKCVELLSSDGILEFVCSDTFLTINTMSGLRNFLMQGYSQIKQIEHFSDETSYGMVRLIFSANKSLGFVTVDGKNIKYSEITSTPNLSWMISSKYSKYFDGKFLSDVVICSSGMTVGNNELFIRKIDNGSITEDKIFEFGESPITLKGELTRARLNKLSKNQINKISLEEKNSVTKKVLIVKDSTPKNITLPSDDYKFYNKAVNESIYSQPKWVIYWKNDGEAVYTYKSTGMWYLHGVGGKKHFFKRAITWALRGNAIMARHLPEGYVLDSGSPVALLKSGQNEDEHYFILGWLNTSLCSEILKSVINHTQNIQGKDVERLPYPFWVSDDDKSKIVTLVKNMIEEKISGNDISEDIKKLNSMFNYKKREKGKNPEQKFLDYS
jgi:adenine-specific DNA-methyltransferase